MKVSRRKNQGLWARLVTAFMRHARKNQTSSKHSSGLRTNFSIAMWSVASVFAYFLLVFTYIYMNNIESGGNAALFFVLVGALIAALLGAFYSSQLATILKFMTPSGRRETFMREQRKADKRKMRR
jgi:uncharacterized membrane protein (GlpM family)